MKQPRLTFAGGLATPEKKFISPFKLLWYFSGSILSLLDKLD
ncbi:hypothetical protein [Pleurocapsa sp. FMAR1]|nr:hypothetical protein [Pleurocapsa sp. FMAR1]